jgi:glycosyltransferase involved in cell wall biosynthesis
MERKEKTSEDTGRVKRSKALYLTYDGLTDPLGQSQVLPYVIGLAGKGHDFTFISFEKKKNYEKNAERIIQLLKENNIKWIPLTYHYQPKIVSTVYDCVRMWTTAKKVVKEQNIELVHCRSYISSLIGLGLKKKFNTKFIFDMRGFWIDERIEGGLWNPRNVLYKMVIKYFRKKEKEFLDYADAIVCLTQKAKEYLGNLDKNYIPKLTVIPCCVDTDKFSFHLYSEAQIKETKLALGIPKDEFVLTYLGSIGTWYLLDDMMEFFKELLKTKSNSTFLFLSNDGDGQIMKAVHKYSIPKEKVIVNQVPNHQVPLYLSLSDYSLFFIMSSFSKQASSPTKQGEIMAMGVPVICNSGVGDTDQIVEKYQSGYLVGTVTITDYQAVIHKILTPSGPFNKEEIRKGALDYFSLSKGVEKYNGIYQYIL